MRNTYYGENSRNHMSLRSDHIPNANQHMSPESLVPTNQMISRNRAPIMSVQHLYTPVPINNNNNASNNNFIGDFNNVINSQSMQMGGVNMPTYNQNLPTNNMYVEPNTTMYSSVPNQYANNAATNVNTRSCSECCRDTASVVSCSSGCTSCNCNMSNDQVNDTKLEYIVK